MPAPFRFLASTSLVLLTLIAVLVCPSSLAALGLGVEDLPALLEEQAREEQRTLDLLDKHQQLTVRQARKQQIARDLVNGRLALADALAQLRSVPDLGDAFQHYLRYNAPGGCQNERRARYLIDLGRD